jgi:hypothetical protein
VSIWTEDKNKSCLQIAAGIKELISKSQQIIQIDYNTCRGLYSILDCSITGNKSLNMRDNNGRKHRFISKEDKYGIKIYKCQHYHVPISQSTCKKKNQSTTFTRYRLFAVVTYKYCLLEMYINLGFHI